MSDSWRLTLPCSRDDAVRIGNAEIEGAVLVATEENEASGRWRLDVYCEHEPDAAMREEIAALVPGADLPAAERLDEQDWVTLSQAGLEPVRAGRFVVHTAAHPESAPLGGRAFLIEAGQAFGTGHHETTAGCLAMLDALAAEVDRFDNIIDLGTGTGLLAFAARELWDDAHVMATDIDPVAIEVTRANMAANGISDIALVVAEGAGSLPVPAGTFDLVIANILAQPLIEMAGDVAALARPGATLVLAGLLSTQASAVIAAYVTHGFVTDRRDVRGDWAILGMRKAR